MSEKIPSMAKGLIKLPFQVTRRILEATPVMPEQISLRTPKFAGQIALVGESCTTPLLAETAAVTLLRSGTVRSDRPVVVRPIIPMHVSQSYWRVPEQAAQGLVNALREHDEAPSVQPLERRMIDARQHTDEVVLDIFDPDERSTQIGVIASYTANSLLSGPYSIHHTLQSGGEVQLDQRVIAPGVVHNSWVPVQLEDTMR